MRATEFFFRSLAHSPGRETREGLINVPVVRDGRAPYRSAPHVTVAGRSAALGEPRFGGPAAAGVLGSTARGRRPDHDKLGSHAHFTKVPHTSSNVSGPAEICGFPNRLFRRAFRLAGNTLTDPAGTTVLLLGDTHHLNLQSQSNRVILHKPSLL
jgi:hypothetical protein